MKLLPPKPPKPEGTEKTVKKKTDDDFTGSTLSDIPEAPEVAEVPEISDFHEEESPKEQDKGEKDIDNIISDDLPPAVPGDNFETEELLPPEISEKSDLYNKIEPEKTKVNKEKKKGLFSKLFRKKETPKSDDKVNLEELPKEEIQDEIKKFEDADSNLDDLSKALEKSIGDEQSLENIASIEDNIVPAPVQEAKSLDQKYESKYKKYAPGKSWDDEITELPDITAPVGLADKKYSKYDGSKKYAKESQAKDESKEEVKTDGKLEIEEITLDKEWVEDSEFIPEEEVKIENPEKNKEPESFVKQKGKEKHGKKEKISKKESKREPKETVNEVEIENASEVQPISSEETEKQVLREQEISKRNEKLMDLEGMNLSGQIKEWKEKSVFAASAKQKPDKKAMVQINSKLKKLLKVYENKLIKIAAEKKKSLLLEINRVNKKEIELENRVNKKEAELIKKEKATQSKESMLVSLEKSLGERKAELDTLVSQEATLTAKKEALQAEISDLRKKSAELKAEIINNQKLFDSQKKTIFQETKNLQDSFKGLKDNFDNEKRKGDRRIADIEKKCVDAQLELDELMKKSRKVAVQLKAKEDALHQKEKEVMELISQEKKILSLLKGNEEKGLTADDIKARRRAKERKPATVIGFGGEPEIYVDDEENLNRKINECKELIRESNYDDAKAKYNQIRDEFMSAVLEDDSRKTIRHELRELYDDIALKMISQK